MARSRASRKGEITAATWRAAALISSCTPAFLTAGGGWTPAPIDDDCSPVQARIGMPWSRSSVRISNSARCSARRTSRSPAGLCCTASSHAAIFVLRQCFTPPGGLVALVMTGTLVRPVLRTVDLGGYPRVGRHPAPLHSSEQPMGSAARSRRCHRVARTWLQDRSGLDGWGCRETWFAERDDNTSRLPMCTCPRTNVGWGHGRPCERQPIGCRLQRASVWPAPLHARRPLLWTRAAGRGRGGFMTIGPVTSSTDATAPTADDLGALAAGTPAKAIEGRSLGRIAWTRLKRDRVAMAGGALVIALILVAVMAPVVTKLFGHPPDEFHQQLIDSSLQTPKGKFGGISRDFLLGLEPQNGRDLFSRIVYGARISLVIAFLATALSVVIGTVMGVISGYFGGWVDTVISRSMDAFLAFPLLLFAIALAGVVPDQAFGLSGNTLRIALLVFIIGFFSWPYIGRIIRGQTLSLREREFVEAARSLGARPMYVIFREVLPNLVAPILIYATLLIPTNILFEAALSFLGVGVRAPTATWGGMLSEATHWYQVAPHFMLFPGLAIFVTVLSFNLFGDGLRDALDPRAR